MSGYYHQNHNPNIPPQYYNVNPNAASHPGIPNMPPHMMAPDGSILPGMHENPMYHGMPGSFMPYGDPSMQQPYLDQYDDVSGSLGGVQGANSRMRRRSGPGDHVKHRRTRSGCYTCRQRRVKCDENHPICERCRKGNRECVYPEAQSNAKSSRGAKSGQKSGNEGSSPEDLDDDDRLPAILDDEEDEDDIASESKRGESNTPGLTVDHSPSPSTEASSAAPHPTPRPPLSRKSSNQTTKQAAPSKPSASIPQDVKFYLSYFKNHMSHHHYHLKRDSSNFLKLDFLQMAIKYEPLRYAVAGYAAYFHTLSRPDGRISHFLQYYNESVSRLRASITKNKKQGLSTFLTILQLASIEEVLGDWVNLMGHQKAAYEILTRLYTPQTITQTELLRKVLLWYIRFDLFVGFQSGGEAVLSRDWYVVMHDYYAQRAREDPDNITLKYEERFAHSRLVAKDSSDLFARKAKGLLSDEDFMRQLPGLTESVMSLDKNIDPALLDPKDYVTDFHGTPDPENIVNPYEPNIIWGDDRWTSNYLLFDMYGIMFMYQVQISMASRKPFDPELTKLAYRVCQVFQAVTEYPKAPPGAIIEAQATMAIAILFLPKDPKTVQWCRRTFARIESSGYIYSNTLRNRILDSWGIEHSDWWLPNDEGCPRIIRSIKDFITERMTAPRDQTSEDLREMKGIFSTLTISDSPSNSDVTSTSPIDGVLSVPSNIDETLIYTGGSPEYDLSYENRFSGADPYQSGSIPGPSGQ
ncbi:hypothetical protein BU24DRAFT_116978 [Aaosphaeria arxii CBS 175.79]|uniref:Zn(2)-C6 fungal-type domain-containing protein n=1 Tax=Aaosphaeria arxii CBS 175.79 TaxID=1450172 RepID=A0A6A5Y267_9PLEO|nr:uncharacterized protein BU24DRAFT_116978 [Aaosphaeria arxii CBS 175.79]KAF2019313.1 hypothetical protein BU24DRAFT_116978 [Aaosphaeria arxii CBS 175.79]